jgi:hypothetical protein
MSLKADNGGQDKAGLRLVDAFEWHESGGWPQSPYLLAFYQLYA